MSVKSAIIQKGLLETPCVRGLNSTLAVKVFYRQKRPLAEIKSEPKVKNSVSDA